MSEDQHFASLFTAGGMFASRSAAPKKKIVAAAAIVADDVTALTLPSPETMPAFRALPVMPVPVETLTGYVENPAIFDNLWLLNLGQEDAVGRAAPDMSNEAELFGMPVAVAEEAEDLPAADPILVDDDFAHALAVNALENLSENPVSAAISSPPGNDVPVIPSLENFRQVTGDAVVGMVQGLQGLGTGDDMWHRSPQIMIHQIEKLRRASEQLEIGYLPMENRLKTAPERKLFFGRVMTYEDMIHTFGPEGAKPDPVRHATAQRQFNELIALVTSEEDRQKLYDALTQKMKEREKGGLAEERLAQLAAQGPRIKIKRIASARPLQASADQITRPPEAKLPEAANPADPSKRVRRDVAKPADEIVTLRNVVVRSAAQAIVMPVIETIAPPVQPTAQPVAQAARPAPEAISPGVQHAEPARAATGPETRPVAPPAESARAAARPPAETRPAAVARPAEPRQAMPPREDLLAGVRPPPRLHREAAHAPVLASPERRRGGDPTARQPRLPVQPAPRAAGGGATVTRLPQPRR